MAVDRVSRGAGEGLAGLAGRVGRRSQGIADGGDGHVVRIEADRARLHLPAAARCAGMAAPRPTYLRRYAPLGAGAGGAVRCASRMIEGGPGEAGAVVERP